ncbi:MAG TPA: magnesium-translocating P-type ATPase [Bacteroidia bacterium]|jgi:Mg2+-importing ATPase|nr:magnesium-translocating P-type ATPase [Bacteroidia bacterium]
METVEKERKLKMPNLSFRSSGNSLNNFDTVIAGKLKAAAKATKEELYTNLETCDSGLTEEQLAEKQQQFGPNEIASDKAPPWFVQFAQAWITPFNGILIVIAGISFVTDVVYASTPEERDYSTVILVMAMVLLSTLIRFWQEFRSNVAAEELKSMVKTTAMVLRQGQGKKEIDIKELVPGDMIFLTAGDMIPGDCRIIQSKDLFVSQAMLTGEALPVEKKDQAIEDAEKKPPLELENICFMGTNVVSGAAVGIITTTGSQTLFGSISKSLTGKRPETSFDKGVNSVAWLLVKFMLVMVPLVFLINGLTKHNWTDALLFAIAIAVGLTPEMLPMVVTANLAKGAMNMSRKKVIVKRLNAIQNIGAMDILCTDKTGTLTLDKIVLERHLNVEGEEDDEVLKWAYLNSFHQTGLRSLLDSAVLEHGEVKKVLEAQGEFKKIDEIPFDSKRRRMSVILEQGNKHLLICKGAVEEMIDICTQAFDPGDNMQLHAERDKIIPMDAKLKENVLKMSRKMNEEGLRVLIVAIKECEANRPINYAVADESNMILTGFIGFLDPAKPSAAPSIKALQRLGIELKVLTGDNEIVTKKICKDVGIPVTNVLLGSEMETLTDAELLDKLESTSIYAKLNPMQKSRVIKVLQTKGHTVGFMGDGINDAGALRDADVGISVDTAVDIAKESADIILLEKDLMVLRKGVIYGRRTFGNIIKYLKMAASSNFGNMFSMLGASALFPFLPMLPVQVLTQNLLYDISQVAIPWDRMDPEYIVKPRRWEAGGIAKFMFYIGPISSIFDYATFAIMYFVFKAQTPEQQSLFQSGWFVEGLISQTLIVHMIRTRRIPFVQSSAAWPLTIMTVLIMIAGIYLPFSPFAASFKFVPLPGSYFLYLLTMLLGYCLLTQVVKVWFIKKFNQWL